MKEFVGSPRSVALLFMIYASTAVAVKCDSIRLANAGKYVLSNATVRDMWSHYYLWISIHFVG